MTRCYYQHNYWLYCPALWNFYVNTSFDYTFTYFLLAFVFLFEYIIEVDSLIFLHSIYYPWSSDGFSGLIKLSKCMETKPLPRSGELVSNGNSHSNQRKKRDIQFVTNLPGMLTDIHKMKRGSSLLQYTKTFDGYHICWNAKLNFY